VTNASVLSGATGYRHFCGRPEAQVKERRGGAGSSGLGRHTAGTGTARRGASAPAFLRQWRNVGRVEGERQKYLCSVDANSNKSAAARHGSASEKRRS